MRSGPFLTRGEAETIHRNAVRVLAETGVLVEHEGVCGRLGAVGGEADAGGTVRFDPAAVERLVFDAPKSSPCEGPPAVTAHVGVYQSLHLAPGAASPAPFDADTLASYVGLAGDLEHVEHVSMLGVPFVPEGTAAEVLPLAEKLWAWRLGIHPDGSVIDARLCDPLVEMFECHAATVGRGLDEVFTATGYLVSPLRLARPECEQLVRFAGRGLRMGIGHMPVQGTTAPITLAGAVTQSLAEQMFLFLLRQAFWGDARFWLGGSISVADMRRGFTCLGRPEQQRANAAFADLARFYGCGASGHTGLTEARAPSAQAGAEKTAGALYTALAVGEASVSAGLMGGDEVCSPVQMVIDNEIVGMLNATLAPARMNDDACAVDEIARVGPGGGYMATGFTAERFRDELWGPRIWDAGPLAARGASDAALERAMEFYEAFEPRLAIGAEEERELMRIIARATRALGGT